MAASSEHGTARIKVQVVATLLPLNIPVHVDPFWAFIRFSESPTICDVENKIVVCLNCMGEEYPVELVVHDHDSPITPAWTYLPTSSTVQNGNHPHQTKISKNNISDASVSEQQLTIVLRPLSRKCGSWIKTAKPPNPVLISYEISDHLPKSARLIFKTQLVFMHDSVLLSGSKSDILRDNDVVTINAICYFHFMKADSTSEGLSCKQMGAMPDVEFEPNVSLWDIDEDSLFYETEAQNRTNTEANLQSEIRTKIDKLLKKLASLQYSKQNEKSSSELRKSKKRKAEEVDSGSELSKRILAVSDKIDAQVEEKRKAEKGDVTSHLSSRVVTFSDRIDVPSEDKRKADHVDNDSVLSNSFVAIPDRSNVEDEKQNKASVDHQWAQDENSVNDDNNTDNQLSKSKKKKKSKKKMKSDVEVDSLMDTSVTQTTDEINQTLQTSLDVNEKQEDLVPVDSVANIAAPSIAKSSRRKAALADLGLSNLLSVLRKQQTHEIKGREKSEIYSQEVDKQRNENTVPVSEKIDVNFGNADNQLDSVISPKRKRVRKRRKKNANSNLDKTTSDKQISESVVRDYTLKLPEHQRPQNNRVTFEADSDDDATPTSQTVQEEIQPVSCVNHNEHNHTDSSVAESAGQLSTQSEGQLKPVHSTDRSEVTKAFSLTVAGAPINPDEKFQALLHQCGRTGRQFETINSANGHTVIRSSRKKRITHTSAVGHTVDPDGDGLTNVSIIVQHSSEAKTPTSNSSTGVQCFIAAVEDGLSNSSHLHNGKLNTRSLITSTPELKPGQPLVEVTPLYMNYSSCTELCGVPKEADIIAYKILEMAEDYTPGLSNFKEAKVLQVDSNTGSLLLEPRGGKDNKKRLGRFELSFNADKDTVTKEELVEVNLADLVDTRLVFRADGSQ